MCALILTFLGCTGLLVQHARVGDDAPQVTTFTPTAESATMICDETASRVIVADDVLVSLVDIRASTSHLVGPQSVDRRSAESAQRVFTLDAVSETLFTYTPAGTKQQQISMPPKLGEYSWWTVSPDANIVVSVSGTGRVSATSGSERSPPFEAIIGTFDELAWMGPQTLLAVRERELTELFAESGRLQLRRTTLGEPVRLLGVHRGRAFLASLESPRMIVYRAGAAHYLKPVAQTAPPLASYSGSRGVFVLYEDGRLSRVSGSREEDVAWVALPSGVVDFCVDDGAGRMAVWRVNGVQGASVDLLGLRRL